jgi:hypothetical protein
MEANTTEEIPSIPYRSEIGGLKDDNIANILSFLAEPEQDLYHFEAACSNTCKENKDRQYQFITHSWKVLSIKDQHEARRFGCDEGRWMLFDMIDSEARSVIESDIVQMTAPDKQPRDKLSREHIQGHYYARQFILAQKIASAARERYDYNGCVTQKQHVLSQGEPTWMTQIPTKLQNRGEGGDDNDDDDGYRRMLNSWEGMDSFIETMISSNNSSVYVYVHFNLMDGSGKSWGGFYPIILWGADGGQFAALVVLNFQYLIKLLDWKDGGEVYDQLKDCNMLVDDMRWGDAKKREERLKTTMETMMKNLQVSIFHEGCLTITTGGYHKYRRSFGVGAPVIYFHPRSINSPLMQLFESSHQYCVGMELNQKRNAINLCLIRDYENPQYPTANNIHSPQDPTTDNQCSCSMCNIM